MTPRSFAALFLLLAPTKLLAFATAEEAVRPHGWIGTTEDWARGLGIAFVVVNLLLLVAAWRSLHRRGETPVSKELLFVAIAVLPVAVVFFGYSYGLEESKSVEACGSCHVMTPYVADLRDPKSETLAAAHFKNRYIQENHCYTCHTDYGMFGTVKAKWEGLGHVARYTTGKYEVPLKIARPYSNLRCLNCHAGSLKFVNPEAHPKEDIAKFVTGEVSCLECHEPAHPRPQKVALR